MARVGDLAEGPTEFDRIWNLHPRFYELFMKGYFIAVRWMNPVTFELCRLRMAQLLGSEFDLALRYERAQREGLTEEKIANVSMYATSDEFSERERASIGFAEHFVIQSSSITDDDVRELQTHITPMEFVLLTKALGPIDQFQRICAALDIRPSAVVPTRLEGFVLAEKV